MPVGKKTVVYRFDCWGLPVSSFYRSVEGAKESSVESGPFVFIRTRYVGIMMGKCDL